MNKKIINILILCFAMINSSSAQDKGRWRMGIGPNFMLPVGHVSHSYGIGFGGDVQLTYGLSHKIVGFLQGGTTFYSYKSDWAYLRAEAENHSHMSMSSILAGARYHVKGFMIGAGGGYTNFNDNGDYPGGFGYSFQTGYSYRNFDFIFHYTGAAVKSKANGDVFSSIGLKVYYNFLWTGTYK